MTLGVFELYLKDRPCDEIDSDALAKKADGYVASDIAYVVNEAATIAAFNHENITQGTHPKELSVFNGAPARVGGRDEPWHVVLCLSSKDLLSSPQDPLLVSFPGQLPAPDSRNFFERESP